MVDLSAMSVLIPLNSGLAWSPTSPLTTLPASGLNPFEFRAGLEQFMSQEAIMARLS